MIWQCFDENISYVAFQYAKMKRFYAAEVESEKSGWVWIVPLYLQG
jgi:hypothetical protein